ncbi:MAG: hypothetical protein R3A79_28330 [Nannocystaceae bacterium]
MKRIFGYLLLIISGFIAFQSYQNAQPSPEIEAMSKAQACTAEGCEINGDRPHVLQTSITARRYQWETSAGSMVVTCEREYLWFGNWSCSGAPGQLAY